MLATRQYKHLLKYAKSQTLFFSCSQTFQTRLLKNLEYSPDTISTSLYMLLKPLSSVDKNVNYHHAEDMAACRSCFLNPLSVC